MDGWCGRGLSVGARCRPRSVRRQWALRGSTLGGPRGWVYEGLGKVLGKVMLFTVHFVL